jgi:YfiR/HmsC-like
MAAWLSNRCALALVFAIAMLASRLAHADAADDRRALVMLRVLAYDKQLSRRSGDEVRIIVVHAGGEAGAAERERWMAAFAKVHKVKVDGRPIVVVAHKFESVAALEKAFETLHPAALLACDGLIMQITGAKLAALTRTRKVLSFSTREADVVAGLSVGVVAGKSRDEIVLNLGAAMAEGVKFDAGLLQLARSIKGAQP